LEKISIIIIDDEKDFADTLAENLIVNLDCTVNKFEDLDTAMPAIIAQKPNIILSDVFMASGSGLRLTVELEKNSIDVPVIYITGMLDSLPNKENVSMLRKPVDIKNLIQLITEKTKA